MVHPLGVSDPSRDRPGAPRAPALPRTAASPKPPVTAGVRAPVAAPNAPQVPKAPSRPPPPGASPAAPNVAPAARVPAVIPVPVGARKSDSDAPPAEDDWGAPAAPPAQREPQRLSPEQRAEVQSLVRSQVDEAVAPVVRAVGDLKTAIEKDRRERAEAPPAKKPSFESMVPAAASPWKETPLGPPVQLTPALPDLEATPAVAPAQTPAAPAAVNHPSIPVSMAPPAQAPQHIDLQPGLYVEIPGALDGSRRRRRLGIFVGFVVLCLVGGLLAAMIASRS